MLPDKGHGELHCLILAADAVLIHIVISSGFVSGNRIFCKHFSFLIEEIPFLLNFLPAFNGFSFFIIIRLFILGDPPALRHLCRIIGTDFRSSK